MGTLPSHVKPSFRYDTDMRWWQRPFYYRPFADRTLCHFLCNRLSLPSLSLAALFPEFDERSVNIREIPRGSWSTPIADILMLLKIAVCAEPKRLMEIGSFRGYTALYLAQHVSPDAKIVAIDQCPDHGAAYRDTPFASKIERRVGETSQAMFANDKVASYDLIFIDADHSYAGVKHDTELVLPLVSPEGFIVWHDYANWGFFNGYNGVPEYLGEFAAKEFSVARIAGSDLAIYSPVWKEHSPAYEKFLSALTVNDPNGPGNDAWTSMGIRG